MWRSDASDAAARDLRADPLPDSGSPTSRRGDRPPERRPARPLVRGLHVERAQRRALPVARPAATGIAGNVNTRTKRRRDRRRVRRARRTTRRRPRGSSDSAGRRTCRQTCTINWGATAPARAGASGSTCRWLSAPWSVSCRPAFSRSPRRGSPWLRLASIVVWFLGRDQNYQIRGTARNDAQGARASSLSIRGDEAQAR